MDDNATSQCKVEEERDQLKIDLQSARAEEAEASKNLTEKIASIRDLDTKVKELEVRITGPFLCSD